MKLVKKFLDLKSNKKKLFVEAYFLLGFSRWLILTRPFSKIAYILGEENTETPESNHGVDIKLVKEVAKAIQVMSKYTFWESKCLVQAYAAKKMLRKRKQKTTVYLGVSKNEKGDMIAHAWLRCGTFFVTGGGGHENFIVTSSFSDMPKIDCAKQR